MDNTTQSHSENASQSGLLSGAGKRFSDDSDSVCSTETWTAVAHSETSVERSVRQTLYRLYFVGGVFTVACVFVLFAVGFFTYREVTYADPVNPDYSLLDADSETYWTDRIQIDIETARQSSGTDELRLHRLRSFSYRTVGEAMNISSSYTRAQAVTSIAMVLAQHDINIILDDQLRRLGNTNLVVSMRARTLISQALMYIRLGKSSAAQVNLQQYNKLVIDADLKLNSPLNEESFFGAVTILQCLSLNDRGELNELFNRQITSTTVIGLDQRMRAYRLIVGEQIRVGMITEALETAKHISNPIELARAWALVLQYSARPPKNPPVEPTMLDLLDNPLAEPLMYPSSAERVANEIFLYLADNKDINFQTSILQRIAGSRLMCDTELYKIFRHCLLESQVLDDLVKQQVLKLLDDPESPTIRAALQMPPRAHQAANRTDSAVDDWSTSNEIVHVEMVNIDPAPLRTRTDQQWIQALLAVAQSYQSVRRFQDADRVLKQTFVSAQKFDDPNIRIPLLMRIGELQIAIGSIAEAQKNFASIAPELNQNQKQELARLQIIGRFFDDAFNTISSIQSPEVREYVCSFLLQEQIRIQHIKDAEKTLTLMPPGKGMTECRSRLNIAKEEASSEDFNILGLIFPEGNNQNWEQYCIGLIQQGFLHLADQTADNISDMQKRTDIRTRIAQEYLLLYQAFNDANDPNRTIRQEIQQAILSTTNRTGQPIIQTIILTELLVHLAGQLQTEEDRTDEKRLWLQAINSCRKIIKPDDKATLFAKLIVVKNILENPNLLKKTIPLFTRETNASAFEETSGLIEECLTLVNLMENEEQQGNACASLAKALAQVGRTRSAQTLHDRVLEIAASITNPRESISMLLSMIPTLKAMDSANAIPMVYRLAIDAVAHEFTGRTSNIDVYDWRIRDSEIEQIVRSQMESGFVDDAVESTNRLNEPVLRDRLLRTAAYIYLDHGDIDRAELEVRRLIVKEIQNSAIQNIQAIKRRSEIRPLSQTQENNL